MGGAQYVPLGMSTIWRNTFLPMRRSILTAKIDSRDHILTEQIAVLITIYIIKKNAYYYSICNVQGCYGRFV